MEFLQQIGAAGDLLGDGAGEHVLEVESEAGLGIGLLSTHTIEAERLTGLLVDLPVIRWDCQRSFWLIRRHDRALTRAEEAFLALLS